MFDCIVVKTSMIKRIIDILEIGNETESFCRVGEFVRWDSGP